jgi:hypothetical protein
MGDHAEALEGTQQNLASPRLANEGGPFYPNALHTENDHDGTDSLAGTAEI